MRARYFALPTCLALASCRLDVLEPRGTIGIADKTILIDSLAIMLARATAATFRGLRSSNCINQADPNLLPGFATRITAVAPTTSNCRNRPLPAFVILPKRGLPPVECSRGVRPNQAAKWRPDSKSPALIVTAMAIAVIGPTPGMAASNRLTGLALCRSKSC
jgi:hypothetical protein